MTKIELFRHMIDLERERQDKKFPNQEKQKSVSLEKWANILTEELGEFVREVNDHENIKAIIELTETAAVCQRIVEIYFNEASLREAEAFLLKRTLNQLSKE